MFLLTAYLWQQYRKIVPAGIRENRFHRKKGEGNSDTFALVM